MSTAETAVAKTAKFNTLFWVQLGVLVAIMLLFEFTGIGFIKLGAVEITIMMIPVVIGAIIGGPLAGAILGGVFGLLSFSEALFAKSVFGEFVFNLAPVSTFVMCLVPRILTGLLAGYIFRALNKIDKTKIWSFAVSSLSGALLNTVFFMGFLVLLFWHNESFIETMQSWGFSTDKLFPFLAAFVGSNGVIEAIVCFVVGAALSKALVVFLPKRNA